jgi:hypothetical protein
LANLSGLPKFEMRSIHSVGLHILPEMINGSNRRKKAPQPLAKPGALPKIAHTNKHLTSIQPINFINKFSQLNRLLC